MFGTGCFYFQQQRAEGKLDVRVSIGIMWHAKRRSMLERTLGLHGRQKLPARLLHKS